MKTNTMKPMNKHLFDMETGDILLVSGSSTRARIIQKFQSKHDQASGKWNHSGIIYRSQHGIYVVEETEIEGRKLKAASRITPIYKYLENPEYEIKLLTPTRKTAPEPEIFERILFKYIGIPYDYLNLIHDQVIRTLTGKWTGRKRQAWKRMLCHEFTMFIWHTYNQELFKEYYKGDVSQIFHSPCFLDDEF